MKSKSIFSIALLPLITSFFVSFACAQPAIEWQKVYPGLGNGVANCISQTSDGGYIVAGYDGDTTYDDFPPYDTTRFKVIKIDSKGNVEWAKSYGGSYEDAATAIIQTSDGGFAVVGSTSSNDGDVTFNHGQSDAWVLKLSPLGAIEWQKTYGGNRVDVGNAILETNDGGFVIAGSTSSTDGDLIGHNATNGLDVWVFKIDSNGKLEWSRTYGGSKGDEANGIAETIDGGFAVAAQTLSSDGDVTNFHGGNGLDIWILKLDSDGALQWERCYGGPGNDVPLSILAAADNGLAIAGYTDMNGGDVTGHHGAFQDDIWVVKLDSFGTLQWEKCFGGSSQDVGYSITQTVDRGYAIAGYTSSNDGEVVGLHTGTYQGLATGDFWILKIDSVGTLQWQKCCGGSGEDEATCIVQSADLGYAIAGVTSSDDGDVTGLYTSGDSSDFWVVKLEGSGCNSINVGLPNAAISARDQDFVTIPIIATDSGSRPVSVMDFVLSLNTDLLTPVRIDPNVGLFRSSATQRFAVGSDSASIRAQTPNAVMVKQGDTICVVDCIAFLTDTLRAFASIRSFDFEDPPFNSSCLTNVGISSVDSGFQFTLIPTCGQTTISSILKHSPSFTIESISPNPTSSIAEIRIGYLSPQLRNIDFELYDPLGRTAKHGAIFGTTTQLDLSMLPSGSYYLRLSQDGFIETKRVVLER